MKLWGKEKGWPGLLLCANKIEGAINSCSVIMFCNFTVVLLWLGGGNELENGRCFPRLTVEAFPLCSNGRWTLESVKTTCSSPALSGGVWFNLKSNNKPGGGLARVLPCAAEMVLPGFPLPRDAVTLGGLSSQLVFLPRSPHYTSWSYQRPRGGCGGREPCILPLLYISTLSTNSRD